MMSVKNCRTSSELYVALVTLLRGHHPNLLLSEPVYRLVKYQSTRQFGASFMSHKH